VQVGAQGARSGAGFAGKVADSPPIRAADRLRSEHIQARLARDVDERVAINKKGVDFGGLFATRVDKDLKGFQASVGDGCKHGRKYFINHNRSDYPLADHKCKYTCKKYGQHAFVLALCGWAARRNAI
jgi:hypothetical protein